MIDAIVFVHRNSDRLIGMQWEEEEQAGRRQHQMRPTRQSSEFSLLTWSLKQIILPARVSSFDLW